MTKVLRIIFGIIFLAGMISVLGLGYEVSHEQKEDAKVNQMDQISVDDNLTNTIKVKLQDGISSSDEIH